MRMTRRAAVQLGAVAPLAMAGDNGRWTAEWDQAALAAGLRSADERFDPGEQMLESRVGPEYRYHSNLRSQKVHPTRDSLEYALQLLEARRDERAVAVLERVLALQDTDPTSKWYGIWGWYLEEPPSKMAPADWNWADFNGVTLLLIEHRHGERLARPLRDRIRAAIRHAAVSIRRRNVAMTYTNIAVKGTFVTLAAAELLRDDELLGYARERWRRFVRTVDETGSFAEYNSPTYARVMVTELSHMRKYWRDGESRALAERIEHRAWLHVSRHWFAPARQWAGPHSRSYSTLLRNEIWLQKALDNAVRFASLEAMPAAGDVSYTAFRCPPDLVAGFVETPPPEMRRELFSPGVQGSTYLEPKFCLGSINRGDFWVQRRPVVAYWGTPERPGYAHLRFLKDDYDFSSALIYSVQAGPFVLGLVNFRTPGGDKHISLDPIPDGTFEAKRLWLTLEVAGDPPFLDFQIRAGGFDGAPPNLVEPRTASLLAQARTVKWAQVSEAWLAFTLAMAPGAGEFERKRDESIVQLRWETPAGELALTGSTKPAAVEVLDAALTESIDGKPVREQRLSEERLV
ncbi:MAG: hypothetical protein SFV54_15290 [Bryobacteraceae bacterium]|nr:hypothetical protein [Bryobacteraceae bacterium]